MSRLWRSFCGEGRGSCLLYYSNGMRIVFRSMPSQDPISVLARVFWRGCWEERWRKDVFLERGRKGFLSKEDGLAFHTPKPASCVAARLGKGENSECDW